MATEEKIIDGEAVEVNSTPVEESKEANATEAQKEQQKAAEEPKKKKRHMPKWLRVTLTHLGAAGIGAGVTVLIGHLFGKDAGDAVQSVTQSVPSQPQISSAPQQQAIGQVAVETVKTVAESVTQNQ